MTYVRHPSHPFPSHQVTTGTKSRTRHPRWHKETFQLLVQEPGSQVLRAVVQDMEMFNLKVRGEQGWDTGCVCIGCVGCWECVSGECAGV